MRADNSPGSNHDPRRVSPLLDGILDLGESASTRIRRDVLLDLLGWHTGSSASQAAVGRIHGLSRERVRQMEAAFLRSWENGHLSAPLRDFLRILQAPVVSRKDLHVACVRARLSRADENLWGLVRLLAGKDLLGGRIVTNIGGAGLLASPAICDRFQRLFGSLSTRITRRGLLNVRPFLDGQEESLRAEILIALETAFAAPLDDGDGIWFFAQEQLRARVGAGLTIAKMFAVAEYLSPREIADGLLRGPRNKREAVSPSVAARLAVVAGVASIQKDGRCRRHAPLRDVLSPSEAGIVRLFEKLGSPASRQALAKAAASRNINITTLNLYLSWAPFVVRTATSLYGLVGTEMAVPQDKKSGMSLTKRVTASTLKNGVVSIPSACRGAATGKIVCVDDGDRELGHIRISSTSISGLRGVLDKLGGREGQNIHINLEPASSRVVVRVDGGVS